MRLVKRTFGEFFKDMGLDPNNVDLICALHKDKPYHLHIHFGLPRKSRSVSIERSKRSIGIKAR